MKVYVIGHVNRKHLAGFFLLMLLCAAVCIAAASIDRGLIYTLDIEDVLQFSHPMQIEIQSVYLDEKVGDATVQSSALLNQPVACQYTNFTSQKWKLTFSYPTSFQLNEQEFGSTEILYHIDFKDRDSLTRGFVEVWNLPYSLKDFLEKSKSTSSLTYKFFNEKMTEVNGLNGYVWDYSVLGSDGVYYRAREVFLKKDARMYRMSFFIPETQWNRKQETIIQHMIKSFKVF